MVVHYRGIIDSDLDMIKEQILPGAKRGGGMFEFYIFLVSVDPSNWSA